jgi:glycosyltransferase involved in cell wall biosynthesis
MIGRVDPKIGGPLQTLNAYVRFLRGNHSKVDILGLKGSDSYSFDEGVGVELAEWPPRNLRSALALVRRIFAARTTSVAILGVWHPLFFADALVRLIARGHGKRVLIPTQSLSPIDWDKHRRIKRFLRPIVRLTLESYDAVVFASAGEREISTPIPTRARSLVVYHPANPLATIPTGTPRLPPSHSVAFFGRIVDQKDPHLLIAAFQHLPQDWTLHIIGSGESRLVGELHRVAEELGVSDRVIWHGWQDRKDAHTILSDAGVLAVTSHAENYCHSAVEAMLLGTPVVMVNRIASALDFGALRCAAVCNPDPIAIAETVLKLTEETEFRRIVLAAGRRFGSERLKGIGVEEVAGILA